MPFLSLQTGTLHTQDNLSYPTPAYLAAQPSINQSHTPPLPFFSLTLIEYRQPPAHSDESPLHTPSYHTACFHFYTLFSSEVISFFSCKGSVQRTPVLAGSPMNDQWISAKSSFFLLHGINPVAQKKEYFTEIPWRTLYLHYLNWQP